MKHFDAVVIGFGKGGKTLASVLAEEGKTVALVERSEKNYGGTCINVGCIPSKSLVKSSIQVAQMKGSFSEKSARYQQAVQEKSRLTAMLRKKNFDKLNQNKNVTIYTGLASFLDGNRLIVKLDGYNEELQGDQIFINTGAYPYIPSIPGLEQSKFVYVSETLMDLETLPEKLVIIGAGYIGIEFASIYANFGSEVTVIQDGSTFLPREDEEIAAAVKESLINRGIRIILSAKVESVEDREDKVILTMKLPTGTEKLPADAVLVAAGRRPNVKELNLPAAGVELNERGGIKVDAQLRTTAHNIWALGDVTGGQQFTYISLDDYRIIRSQLLASGEWNTENRPSVPYSVFLSPPFSRVGLSEREARQKGYSIKTARLPVSAIPKAQVLGQTTGILKAVIDADTNQILGAHLFCAESHEMINLIKLAMDAKLPYSILRDNIYTHPTMSEALNDLLAVVQ